MEEVRGCTRQFDRKEQELTFAPMDSKRRLVADLLCCVVLIEYANGKKGGKSPKHGVAGCPSVRPKLIPAFVRYGVRVWKGTRLDTI